MGATTDEVALYLNLQGTFDLQSAKLYRDSSNTKFTDSYCKKYTIYYSEEQVTKQTREMLLGFWQENAKMEKYINAHK